MTLRLSIDDVERRRLRVREGDAPRIPEPGCCPLPNPLGESDRRLAPAEESMAPIPIDEALGVRDSFA